MRNIRGIAVALLCVPTLFGTLQATAQQETPVAPVEFGDTFTLVERADHVTKVDVGEPGPSAGDIEVWGPNPLYDEANEVDTGAVTQGSCLALNATGMNHCLETIVFADGSTLEFQGVQPELGDTSMTTIVGGSGVYLGATGTMTVAPSADGQVWTKTITLQG